MNAKARQKNRHGEIAEDSHRVCVIIPDCEYNEIRGLLSGQRPTVSSVVREFTTVGLQAERAKNERAKDQSASGIDAR